MQEDADAFQAFSEDSHPVLKFYAWEKVSASYGHFIKPEEHFNFDGLKKHQVEIAKRPTGGGILFHHVDISFSILLPRDHPLYGQSAIESYRAINGKIKIALEQLGVSFQALLHDQMQRSQHEKFCMAHPTIYDLVIEGRKIAGGAQRRGRNALLHQGSICLEMPEEGFYEEVLLPNLQLLKAFRSTSCPLKLTEVQVAQFKRLFFDSLT